MVAAPDGRDEAQKRPSRTIRLPSILLPILEGVDADSNPLSELRLRQVQKAPESHEIPGLEGPGDKPLALRAGDHSRDISFSEFSDVLAHDDAPAIMSAYRRRPFVRHWRMSFKGYRSMIRRASQGTEHEL